MSKLSTSMLSTAGLLLVTTLAIIPTRLHAETKVPTPTTVASPVPAIGGTDSLPKIAETRRVVVPELIKPSTEASIATPNKPVTSNAIPTSGKSTSNAIPATTPTAPAKPAVAATSKPPTEELVTLTLKLKEKKVYVYKDGKTIASYPVAIGKKGWETPTGDWYVMEKITNPGWTSFKNGSVVAPGAKSPLGERWIGFWTDGKDMIGFHGTPDVKSIGKAVSHGCVRMHNKDVKALFPLVKVGTTVKVVNE
ncbi:MAG: L,D-transpeptidase family protein [Chamaesiphon sp.]|nr:L,D-transpeptidase family protein [Chamaesiphon sp.]